MSRSKDKREKLIKILTDMFQFDQADLDFGIYRIMNQKRDRIEEFMNKELFSEIEKALEPLSANISQSRLEELKNKVSTLESMNDDGAFNQKISELKDEMESYNITSNIDSIESEIYSYLTEFFRRYYDEGDFISQRRYKEGVYAIPYEGEEVKLHWANHDQYYVKSSEYFYDYSFKTATGEKINFKLLDVEVEKDNNKGDKKTFQIIKDKENNPEIIGDELFIYFQYIEDKTSQKKRNEESLEFITEKINELKLLKYEPILRKITKSASSEMEKQINRYTARNTYDYFIHKDLEGFLKRELDFYIKNEVLHLENMDLNNLDKLKEYIIKGKVIETIANTIIKFLAQLEEFQKSLWLKKKFIVETNYSLTLDRIDKKFYEEIIKNKDQIEEWKKLFIIDELEDYSEPLTIEFLGNNPYLMLDTKFFDGAFREELIGSIDNLDETIDGILINSDNFHALNLLQEKYREKIDCVYIDPPYNTGTDNSFNYKDNYHHSSWISMMKDRTTRVKETMSNKASFFVSTDDGEYANVKQLLDTIFGNENFIADIIWNSRKSVSNDALISDAINHTTFYAKDKTTLDKNKWTFRLPNDGYGFKNPDNDPLGSWKLDPMDAPNIRENLSYPIKNKITGEIFYPPEGRCWRFEEWQTDELLKQGRILFGLSGNARPAYKRYLSDAKEKGLTPTTYWNENTNSERGLLIKEKLFMFNELNEDDKRELITKVKSILDYYSFNYVWDDVGTTTEGTKELLSLFKGMINKSIIDKMKPKPTSLIEKAVNLSTVNNSHVIDFFAGSGTTGHAVINLNREDKGNRKYILVEMGEYFDTVTKPRIQKVIYSEEWKDGKPVGRKGSSHTFKYFSLESYEDALNNIIFEEEGLFGLLPDASLISKEYMVSYMLKEETKDSKCLLNIEEMKDPFNYQMKITEKGEQKDKKIDIIETFNYLLGIRILRNHSVQTYDAEFTEGEYGKITASITPGTTYRFKAIEGILPTGEGTLIIWRSTTGDSIKDNEVLNSYLNRKRIKSTDFEYDVIYVNGDNFIKNINIDGQLKVKLIEEEMKARMFEGVMV